MLSVLRPLWSYRAFVLGNVQREFQSRYRNSLLGASWTIINPLAMIAVYTLIFSQIMQTRLPGLENHFAYSLYLCAGILTWGLFSEITLRSQTMFIDNANVLKKINFPRLCLPVTVVATALLNFAIIFGLFTVFLIIIGQFPGLAFLALVPLLALLLAFAASIGLMIGVLNVFFRDVGQLFTIGLSFWFWLTPIVYPVAILPEQVQGLIALNPMTGWIRAVQDVVVLGRWPDFFSVLPMLGLSCVFALIGSRLFYRLSGDMVDEL